MTLPSGYVTTWPSAGAEYTPTSRVGATSRPVSSRTSRASASDTDSPGSTLPPGRPQSPLSLRRCSRTPSPARMIADTPGRITMTRHCTDAVDAGQPAVVQAKMRDLVFFVDVIILLAIATGALIAVRAPLLPCVVAYPLAAR